MRLKSPAVSMAFFKVAAGNPVITVPLPTRAGNGVPSAKTVPGADTKICHLTEPEFSTPYKRVQSCMLSGSQLHQQTEEAAVSSKNIQENQDC
jgi:hypothetical protein